MAKQSESNNPLNESTSSEMSSRRSISSYVWPFLAATLAVFLCIGIVSGPRIIKISLAAPAVVLIPISIIGLAAIMWFYIEFRHLRPLDRTHIPTMPMKLQIDDAHRLLAQAKQVADLNATDAMIFALAILSPASIRQRVVEEYEPSSRTLHQRIVIDGEIPSDSLKLDYCSRSREISFPVMTVRKGQIYDNFVLKDGTEVIAALAHQQYLTLTAGILYALLAGACNMATSDKSTRPMSKEEEDALCLALLDVMQQNNGNSEVKQLQGVAALKHLNSVTNKSWRTLMIALIEKLSNYYAIVANVTCDEDGKFRLEHERTVIPSFNLSGDPRKRTSIKGLARLFLGARPVDINIPLVHACTGKSYHLRVNSEEGLYLLRQDALALESYVKHHRKSKAVLPYYRFTSRQGQSYGHFYSRSFPEPAADQSIPDVRFTFLETPPGSIFRAMIAAMASFALICLVGFVSANAGDSKLEADAAAFLLVFPAVAAAWLGFESPRRRLLEGTLDSRISLSATALMSVAASGLYMIYQAKIFDNESPAVHVFGTHVQAWSILIFCSLLNVLWTSYRYCLNTMLFVRICQPRRVRQNPNHGSKPDNYDEINYMG